MFCEQKILLHCQLLQVFEPWLYLWPPIVTEVLGACANQPRNLCEELSQEGTEGFIGLCQVRLNLSHCPSTWVLLLITPSSTIHFSSYHFL